MLIVFIRTIVLYLVIVIIMRLMGKRQIGQLQPSELVVALVIADLAAVPMGNVGIPLINGIIPIITLFVAEELLSYIALKSERARGFICGTPSIIIDRGIIVENEMRRLRYNLNDLLEQLRLKSVTNIEDVEYAILETDGQLSVIPTVGKRPLTPADMNLKLPYEGLPISVIMDGRINSANLAILNKDEEWLKKQLGKANIKSVKDIFFAYMTADKKLHFQVKNSSIKQTINVN